MRVKRDRTKVGEGVKLEDQAELCHRRPVRPPADPLVAVVDLVVVIAANAIRQLPQPAVEVSVVVAAAVVRQIAQIPKGALLEAVRRRVGHRKEDLVLGLHLRHPTAVQLKAKTGGPLVAGIGDYPQQTDAHQRPREEVLVGGVGVLVALQFLQKEKKKKMERKKEKY